jgi:hypothetical protein
LARSQTRSICVVPAWRSRWGKFCIIGTDVDMDLNCCNANLIKENWSKLMWIERVVFDHDARYNKSCWEQINCSLSRIIPSVQNLTIWKVLCESRWYIQWLMIVQRGRFRGTGWWNDFLTVIAGTNGREIWDLRFRIALLLTQRQVQTQNNCHNSQTPCSDEDIAALRIQTRTSNPSMRLSRPFREWKQQRTKPISLIRSWC